MPTLNHFITIIEHNKRPIQTSEVHDMGSHNSHLLTEFRQSKNIAVNDFINQFRCEDDVKIHTHRAGCMSDTCYFSVSFCFIATRSVRFAPPIHISMHVSFRSALFLHRTHMATSRRLYSENMFYSIYLFLYLLFCHVRLRAVGCCGVH